MLRESKKSRTGTRKKSNGEALRKSWELDFLSMPMNKSISTDGFYCLYEAPISVGVIGINHTVWTAYGFIDAYFESRDAVNGCHYQLGGTTGPGQADPLASGGLGADKHVWTPGEYFFKVFEIWIIDKLEKEVKQYV